MLSGTFVFSAIERIAYGQPAIDALRAEAERLDARRVFVLVSGTMNRETDVIEKIRAALGSRYAGFHDRMPSYTPRDAVLSAVREARAAGADLIVTFGGGSVTDAGKLMRLCLRHGITDIEGFDAFHSVYKADGTQVVPKFDGPAIPQIAIPTTLSGGEFNGGASSLDPRNRMKDNYSHRLLVPSVIILDPAVTLSTPLWVWLSTGIRAVDHATEGLCSIASINPVSDMNFMHALKLLGDALPRVKKNPADLEARLDCQLGMWLSLAGRLGGAAVTGASHGIGHVLGAVCNVAHGHTSCVMLPPVLRYNRPVNAGRQRLVAEAMGHAGEDAADVIAALIAELGLPGRLSEVAVRPEHFDRIADHAMQERSLHTNPRKISSAGQVLEILHSAA